MMQMQHVEHGMPHRQNVDVYQVVQVPNDDMHQVLQVPNDDMHQLIPVQQQHQQQQPLDANNAVLPDEDVIMEEDERHSDANENQEVDPNHHHQQQQQQQQPQQHQEVEDGEDGEEEEDRDLQQRLQEDDPFEDTYKDVLHSLSRQWLSSQLTHKVSGKATNLFWDIAFQFIPKLLDMKHREGRTKNIPKFIQQRRLQERQYCPDIHMEFGFKKKSDGSIIIHSGPTTPLKAMQLNSDYVKLYEIAYVKVSYNTTELCSNMFKNILKVQLSKSNLTAMVG